jgi:hypothetical protein
MRGRRRRRRRRKGRKSRRGARTEKIIDVKVERSPDNREKHAKVKIVRRRNGDVPKSHSNCRGQPASGWSRRTSPTRHLRSRVNKGKREGPRLPRTPALLLGAL